MNQALQDQLRSELDGFGIPCDERTAKTLLAHLDLVIEKNRVMNLTRITDPVEAVTLHVVDSLLPLALPEVSLGELDHLMDMGTGAGFPGIPLTVVTGCQATLVDSVGKKVVAVQEFAEALGLSSVTAVHARLEDLARTMLRSQSHVVARAVAQTNVLIEYATPFLADNGLLVVEKGRPTDEELGAASRAAVLCGLESVSRETFELPRDLGHREVLLYRKTGKAKIRLPRRVGDAKRAPLGVN